jgi:hypothetical protein
LPVAAAVLGIGLAAAVLVVIENHFLTLPQVAHLFLHKDIRLQ